MALPKAYRLKSRRDFQAVFREGIRCHSSHFTLRALKPSRSKEPSLDTAPATTQANGNENLASTQIGISISTKVSKRAVVRNRIKRQITGALYQLLPRLSPGWRLVVIVKPKSAESECVSQQFLQELEQLLAKAEVINGHS
ncbi:ribonuclease P protein component [Anabaena cylindrica FACHB-243]|uniref:Ribonuclease P protein component n=1 Tax=Anabaena cylindrica (strain ATCC 27899 / PCC 7122) TaxID=272123 RepID=K9ZHN0_ANACC|nr:MULTISPECIES: ribonuclease P protein component [Anabaena]AFZ58254.1 ribonuclease P protein component [Anabaena cylindrica PCC 7122]MBD2419902.1 ribonuclease P protein component [Anabaena cylindrica FACHB-243]MBY5281028.1 ribonuclease P protein component [Anabaena sp. CCAP 1446/1C]MBY5307321.1 ribonuclease P protein component [Anabaena sp. CCAP 1446/1C]MCM2407896.1 ribonuclease P protein component [Anabaena sp. CCAP 1446/1C]